MNRNQSVPKLAILVPEEDLEEFYKEAKKNFEGDLHIILGDFFVEFLNKGINKATALESLLNEIKAS